MHEFNLEEKFGKYLTSEIVNLISEIHEHKGKQELFLEANIDELKTLLEIAKIQSVGASNRIEGIFSSDKRLSEIVKDKAEPKNRSEEEIAGYREVLSTIHESYDFMNPRPNIILQLHKNLYSYSTSSVGGVYKSSDNIIAEVGKDGVERIRFKPVSAFQTSQAMNDLCENFIKNWEENKIDKLLLIPMFILDFLCIHPFNDGNGRMSRLLTLMLFYKAGYIVGKYISIEMIIEKSKETYYESLQFSSNNWHENNNDYEPFIRYYLGILLNAYKDFESRVKLLQDRSLSKPDRIKSLISQKLGKITKAEIIELCPDISKITIERTLNNLCQENFLEKRGGGRSTFYVLK